MAAAPDDAEAGAVDAVDATICSNAVAFFWRMVTWKSAKEEKKPRPNSDSFADGGGRGGGEVGVGDWLGFVVDAAAGDRSQEESSGWVGKDKQRASLFRLE